MTEPRPTASTITDVQLDALYEQLERAQRVAMQVLDQPAPDEPTPSRRAGLRDEIAAAIWERQNPGRAWADCEHPWQADAEADADAIMPVLYRAWPWLRAEAEDTVLGKAEAENKTLREDKTTLQRAVRHLMTGNRKTVNELTQRAEAAEHHRDQLTALYERWVKAGPPPLGTSVSRWWDTRLAELHTALSGPAHDAGPSIAECRDADRVWPLQKGGE